MNEQFQPEPPRVVQLHGQGAARPQEGRGIANGRSCTGNEETGADLGKVADIDKIEFRNITEYGTRGLPLPGGGATTDVFMKSQTAGILNIRVAADSDEPDVAPTYTGSSIAGLNKPLRAALGKYRLGDMPIPVTVYGRVDHNAASWSVATRSATSGTRSTPRRRPISRPRAPTARSSPVSRDDG